MRRMMIAAGLFVMTTGFARQSTDDGTPLQWGDECPLLEIGRLAEGGPSADVVHDELEAAIEAWTSAGCDQLPIGILDTPVDLDRAVYDGHDLVITRPADYCDRAENAAEPFCLNGGVLATTTVYSVDNPGDPRHGEIIETDLEINLAYAFSSDGTAGAFDLRSVIVHEVGHMIGLDHACTEVRDERKVDPAGHALPTCFDATDDIRGSIMFPRVSMGEVRHALAPDELRAMCLVYQARAPRCERGYVAGWSCSSTQPSLAIGLLVLGLGLARRRSAGGRHQQCGLQQAARPDDIST